MQDHKPLKPMRIAVTGGSGYIGRHLCRMSLAQGFDLTILGRTKPHGIDVNSYKFISYDLVGEAPALQGHDAVIHLASAGLNEETKSDTDILGTRALATAAKAAGVPRFIFVSSQSASMDAPTSYGRSKFAVEEMLSEFDAYIVRPGLVCGGEDRGVYGKLCDLVRGAPIVPIACTSTLLQPVHVNMICKALLKLSNSEFSSTRKIYYLGGLVPIPFGQLIKKLAWFRFGRRPQLITLPIRLVLFGISIFRGVPGFPNIPRERVLGLTDIKLMDCSASFVELGIAPVDVFTKIVQENPKNRYQLIKEARAFIQYISRSPAQSAIVRRYVRAIELTRGGAPLPLPRIIYTWPILLRLLEPVGSTGLTADRLAIAMRIVETVPESVEDFCVLKKKSWLVSCIELVGLMVIEAVLMPVRLLLGLRN